MSHYTLGCGWFAYLPVWPPPRSVRIQSHRICGSSAPPVSARRRIGTITSRASQDTNSKLVVYCVRAVTRPRLHWAQGERKEQSQKAEGGTAIASQGRYGGTRDRWKNLLGHTKYCTVFAREMPFGNYVLLLCTWRQIFRPQTLVCLLSYTLEQVITAYNCRTSKVGIISCANVPT